MDQRPAALGFKIHTGWAAYVAVTRHGDDVTVLSRGRVELLPPGDAIPRFVYHEASNLEPAAARDLIRRAERASQKLARAALAEILTELHSQSAAAAFTCGVIGASTRLKADTALQTILQSHPLIHAGEGMLFQDAVVTACEKLGLRATLVRERDLWNAAARACKCGEDTLRKRIDSLRKIVGAPWSADEKSAAAAALIGAISPQMEPQLTQRR